MALRPFHRETRSDRRGSGVDAPHDSDAVVPDAPSLHALPTVAPTRIVGGSQAYRRANGQIDTLHGVHVYDPVFLRRDADALRAFAAPDQAGPLVVEIGFQLGRFARGYCTLHPEARYLGFEIRRKFVEVADAYLERAGCSNRRLALCDAREALPELVVAGSVQAIYTLFPDPWWKSKHRKRRLIDRDFAALAATVLAPGGVLLVKTDVLGYAAWAAGELAAVRGLEVHWLRDATAGLPPSRRERGCLERGLPTWALRARRLDGVPVEILSEINPFDAADDAALAAAAPPPGDSRWR